MDCNETVGMQWILVGMDCNGFLNSMGAMDTCKFCTVGCAVGYLKVWMPKIPVGIVECGVNLRLCPAYVTSG